jgi:hypothetical protein
MTTSAGVSQPSFLKRFEALIQMALARALDGLIAYTAAANNVSAAALATGAAAGVPYVAIAAPSIAKKASGKYLVTGYVTIDKNAGTLADGDNLTLTPRINGVAFSTPVVEGTAVTSGATVQGCLPFSFIMPTAPAAGPFVIDMQLTASNGHTSSVLANNGFISVVELPA